MASWGFDLGGTSAASGSQRNSDIQCDPVDGLQGRIGRRDEHVDPLVAEAQLLGGGSPIRCFLEHGVDAWRHSSWLSRSIARARGRPCRCCHSSSVLRMEATSAS